MKAPPPEVKQGAADPADATTLRDEFALQAITGCLCGGRTFDKAELAAEAYEMADAMLHARKKEAK